MLEAVTIIQRGTDKGRNQDRDGRDRKEGTDVKNTREAESAGLVTGCAGREPGERRNTRNRFCGDQWCEQMPCGRYVLIFSLAV